MASLPTVGAITRPRQEGYHVAIGDLLLRLAVAPDRQLEIVTAPKEAPRLQIEQTSEDYLPEFGQVFSRNDFSGGQGLDFAYKSNLTDLDRTRYWDSKGIDVSLDTPGTISGIELLTSTSKQAWGSGAALSMVLGGSNDDQLFVAGDTSTVTVVADPLDVGSTSSEDPHSGSQIVEGLAALGAEVFAACGTDGIGKRSSGGTWSDLVNAPTSIGVWAAKGRLISDDGNGTVSTISLADGTATTLITINNSDQVNSVVDAGPVILIGTNQGTIYGFRDDSGTLSLVNQSRITPTDDVRCMAWSAGSLIVGTYDGLRGRIWSAEVGTSDRDFTVTGTQLLREVEYEPNAAAAGRIAIYVGVQSSATEAELWRFDTRTTGIARHQTYSLASAGSIVALEVLEGKVIAAVDQPANGVYRPTSSYVSEGYLISPMADFYQPNSKTWVDIVIQAENVGLGNTIELLVATDVRALTQPYSTYWTQIARVVSPDSLGERLVLPSTSGRYAAIQVRLQSPSDGSSTPKLTSFALRSYADSDDFIVRMPVNVSDQIERPGRQPFRVKGWGHRVYTALLGLDGEFETIEFYEPALTFRGVIQNVGTPISAMSHRGSVTTFCIVEARGRILTAGTGSESSGTLGVETLGIHQLGV